MVKTGVEKEPRLKATTTQTFYCYYENRIPWRTHPNNEQTSRDSGTISHISLRQIKRSRTRETRREETND